MHVAVGIQLSAVGKAFNVEHNSTVIIEISTVEPSDD